MYIGLTAGVVKLDSEDFCCNSERNLAIVVAKSAVSSYSGSGLSKCSESVDICGICGFCSTIGDFSY